MPLNDLRCKNAKSKTKPYRLYDTEGLYLVVKPSGGRSWRLKYRFHGREKTLTLGKYPAIGLKEARKARDDAREQLSKGFDPSYEKGEDKRYTLLIAAKEWFKQYYNTWSPKHSARLWYRLEKDMLQDLGHIPVKTLTPKMLLKRLQKIEESSAERAIRTLHYLSEIFQYAGLMGKLDRDLTLGLKKALKTPTRGHYACIPLEELPAFVKALYTPVSKRRRIPNLAARMLMLTFVRTNELLQAEWKEFDFVRKLWRIPAHRMKMRREHIVPLSRQVIEILTELKSLNGHRSHVFASPVNPKMPMAKDVVLKELERIGYKTTMSGHGFRTLAMGVIKEMIGYNHDPVDRQLAHLPKNSVDRAYDRSSFMRQRIPMMQAYADCIDAINNHEITYEELNDEQYYRHYGDTSHTNNTENIEYRGSVTDIKNQPIHILPRHQSGALSEAV